jgi:hypothetical protein
MEGGRRDEPGSGGLRIGHGSIYAGDWNFVKDFLRQS